MKFRLKKTKTVRQRQKAATSDNVRSPAFSYGANRPDQESLSNREAELISNAKNPKQFARFWLQRVGFLILILAVTAAATSSLTLSANPEIVPTADSRDSSAFLHSQATYQVAASKLIADSFFNRNKITINTASISQQLIDQFPELSSANITLPLLAHRPIIHIQASKPAIILLTNNGSYVLDSNGKAVLPSERLSSTVQEKLPKITDQSGLKVTLNHQILTSSNVNFIQTIIAQLDAKKVGIESLTLPSASSEVDAKIAGQPYFVKFNLQSGDARRQAGAFLATQAQLRRKNITPSQYIDVRVEGRAYYR